MDDMKQNNVLTSELWRWEVEYVTFGQSEANVSYVFRGLMVS